VKLCTRDIRGQLGNGRRSRVTHGNSSQQSIYLSRQRSYLVVAIGERDPGARAISIDRRSFGYSPKAKPRRVPTDCALVPSPVNDCSPFSSAKI